MKKNWHISIAVVCLVLGLLLATSYNTQQRNRAAQSSPRKDDLIQTIHELEKERDKLNVEVKGEREQIAKYEAVAAKQQGLLSSYTQDLEKTKTAAGLTQVKGRGLLITLADAPAYPKDDNNINNYVIHDYDIRLIVNSLWAGGAEAISVNDQRLISTSSMRCAGGYILVNSIRLVSPFTIKAVGNPERMLSVIDKDVNAKRIFDEYTSVYGLIATKEKKDDISVPGYNGRLLVESAKVMGGEN